MLALIVRPGSARGGSTRIAVVQHVRTALNVVGSWKSDAQILQTLAGGQAARPFATHSNAPRHRSACGSRAGTVPPSASWVVSTGLLNLIECSEVGNHGYAFSGILMLGTYRPTEPTGVVTRELIQEVADEAIRNQTSRCPTAVS